MAKNNSTSSRSSSNSALSRSVNTSPIRASCYLVDAMTRTLSGMQYSSTGAGGVECRPHQRISTGNTNGRAGRAGRNNSTPGRGAANTITEECERLFCGTLRAVFMGEMGSLFQDPLVMGSHIQQNVDIKTTQEAPMPQQQRGRGQSFASASSYSSRGSDMQSAVMQGLGTPSSITSESDNHNHASMPDQAGQDGWIKQYLEMWDYSGGAKFKGFATSEKTMVVFFDDDVVHKELKSGLMALIELASTSTLACEHLLVCLERNVDDTASSSMMRDLRWVGFEPTTLARWSQGHDLTSDRWMFLGMEA